MVARTEEEQVRYDLEYYMDETPTDTDVAEAMEWKRMNPDIGLAEWVSAIQEVDEQMRQMGLEP